MAVEENLKDTKLKVKVNYGEKEGKIERGSKTYGDVRHDATKEHKMQCTGYRQKREVRAGAMTRTF